MTPTNPDYKRIIEKLEEMEKDIGEIKRILRGSNGSLGLISSVQSLTNEMHDHIKDEFTCPIKDVATMLYGAKDDASKRGLVADVEEIKRWKNELSRWYALFVGAIIVGVVNILISLVNP